MLTPSTPKHLRVETSASDDQLVMFFFQFIDLSMCHVLLQRIFFEISPLAVWLGKQGTYCICCAGSVARVMESSSPPGKNEGVESVFACT